MELKDYAVLVDTLRREQRTYFRTKNPEVLKRCKYLENQVDKATDSILRPLPPGLFDKGSAP